jgi:hypothetical protein
MKSQKNTKSIILALAKWENNHPYAFSFFLSFAAVLYLLFRVPSLEVLDNDAVPTDRIQFVDIDQIQAPKRVVKKEYTTEDADVSEDTTNVERAVGTSDDANAVDLSFYPNIAPPRPIGRLRKIYPKEAKKENLEATVHVELLIAINGKVKNVKIFGVRLNKALPTDLENKYSKLFSRDAFRILLGAKFSPPILNGKRVAIKMSFPLKFRLN